ncbi:13558_t:CDS:2, partial [Funneliformis mosseae]
SNSREFNATTNESESSQSDDSEANIAGKNNEPPCEAYHHSLLMKQLVVLSER